LTNGFAGTKVYNTFVAGLITEAGPLTFPENASADESNCVIFRKGNRRRRLGHDYESNYTLSTNTFTDAQIRDKAISQHEWTAVAGNGTRNFLILQFDTTLLFYDLATVPLSNGLKSSTVNLATHAATGATDVGSEPIEVSSGKGLAFIASKKIDPFFLEYTPSSDTFTATEIEIKIRDFDGLDDSLESDNEPVTLTKEHEYNLKNQGWETPGTGESNPVTTYFNSKAVYPSNAKQWWVGKNASDDFEPGLLSKYDAGNTLAPRGRFLLNPFYKDRSNVSGVASLPVVAEDNRPELVEFFAGRAWYFGIGSAEINGHIYFSQVMTKPDRVGRCYQESDPTTEDLNELLDSDGGVIVIPEIGTIRGSFITDRFLVIFASNGVWSISGGGADGFKATDFGVRKITEEGCVNKNSIIGVKDTPYWWSETGIHRLTIDQVSGNLVEQNMSETTINTFYKDNIPTLSKMWAQGKYDPGTKRLYWYYNDTAPANDEYRWRFDSALVFDTTMGAFYPWAIGSLASLSPYVAALINTTSLNTITREDDVVDGSGNNVVDASANQVIVNTDTVEGSTTFLKMLVIKPTGSDANKFTFGEISNQNFLDWESVDSVGVDYTSFMETGQEIFGDPSLPKQVPYIYTFFNKTETGVTDDTYVNPSSCFLTVKWDWANSGNTGKWSTKRQVYRMSRYFQDNILLDEDPGQTVIVSREKIRGKGRAIKLRFESEDGKDFDLIGWQSWVDSKTTP
jgi:hypothetical protein